MPEPVAAYDRAMSPPDQVTEGLSEDDLAPTPFRQAVGWVDEAAAVAARGGPVAEPVAMSLATADESGHPNVRTVLMRFFDERGPGFVSSADSAKAAELAATGWAAASLTWPGLHRAIRFRGRVEPIADDEVEAYWRTRPWGSRISAWASRQSAEVADRSELETAAAQYAARWPDRARPDDVPVPPSWRGWRIAAEEVEFWAGRRDRLHDRLVFVRRAAGSLDDAAAWRVVRRQP